MPEIRKCAQCQHPSLMPLSRKMQVFNSVIHYKCGNCGTEVDITPLGSIGTTTMVGIMALGFWGTILFWGSTSPGMLAMALFGGAAVAFAALVIAPPVIVHLQYPAIKDSGHTPLQIGINEKHIFKAPIIWIEKFGFLAGLIAPVFLVLCVLGAATLIGFINYTYF